MLFQSDTVLTSDHVIRFVPASKDEEIIGLFQIELESLKNGYVQGISCCLITQMLNLLLYL